LFLALLVALAAPLVLEAQAAPPFAGSVVSRANLRAGPGTTHAIVGDAVAGQAVRVTGCNADCSWYQLDTGNWIVAFLVAPAASEPVVPMAAAPARPYSMPDPATLTAATVTSVADGDTIQVRINNVEYRVRYIGINTPEVGQPYAEGATSLNRSLAAGKTVLLERDVSETDRYGRLLRYIWLEDGTFVNYELVRQGYAQASAYSPDVKYEALFREAQRQALEEGAGLWAETVPPTATPTVASRVAPVGASANRNANLRAGPGTSYAVAGSVTTGQALDLGGRNTTGDWFRLSSGLWIAAFLVDGAPGTLPVVTVQAVTPPSTPEPTAGASRSTAVILPESTPVTPPQPTIVTPPTPVPPTPVPPPVSPGSLVITGVDKRAELVTIRNTGGAPVNMRGWRLVSEKGNQAWTVPFDFQLQPGATVTIHALSGANDASNLYSGFGSNIWNNSEHDPAALYDAAGVLVSRYP